MIDIKQAVILAGGLGTRLRPITKDKYPKPMIPIHGRPFLEYLFDLLIDNGVEEAVLLLGHLHDKVFSYFGDSYRNLKIKYSVGDADFETGRRIKQAEKLLDDKFLLMYCDNYWPLNLRKLVEFHEERNPLMTVTVYTNKDGITTSNTLVDGDGYVKIYDKTRKEKNVNGVEIGFFIVNRKAIDMMPDSNFSLEKVIFPALIKKGELCGYLTDQRYYSIGDPKKVEVTKEYLKPKKAIFLDRDGVINKKAAKADYVKKWEEFDFLPGVLEAIKMLTKAGYDIYIISNQPGIARGKMSMDDLKDIEKKCSPV